MVGLAVVAGVLELATMLPYLAALGLLDRAGLGFAASIGVLLGYCVVMVAPALVLLVARSMLHRHLEPLLGRISSWIERTTAGVALWVLGIAGFLVGADAARSLQLLP